MEVSLSTTVQLAKNELRNTITKIKDAYRLPPFILDGILSETLAEVRSEEQAEVSSQIMTMFLEKDKPEEGEEEDGECRSKTEFVPRSE